VLRRRQLRTELREAAPISSADRPGMILVE